MSEPNHPAGLSGKSRSISRREALTRAAAGAALLGAPGILTGAETASKLGKGKGRIHHSLSRWCYNKLSLDALCQNAVRIGYGGIDLIGPRDWPTVKKHGLVPTMVPGAGSISSAWNRVENHDRLVEDMKRNIDLAADAGLRNVITFSGNRRGLGDEEGAANCILGLKRVAGHAEKRKVTICIELLNSKVNHKDYQADHTAWGVKVCKGVGSPACKLLYDIYHMQIMEGDIIRTIRESIDYIGHFHTGGNPGRNEIDETQEIYYPAVMRAIVDLKFDGWVAQEFVPKGDPVRAMEQAFRICDV